MWRAITVILAITTSTSVFSGKVEKDFKKQKQIYFSRVNKANNKLAVAQKARDKEILEATRKYIKELVKVKKYWTKKGELEKALDFKDQIDDLQELLDAGRHSSDAIELKGPESYNPTASHTYGPDSVAALCDGITPKSSFDISIPRHSFWPHKGTNEYLQYTFKKAINVFSISVYWYDDSPGGCRTPKRWKLYYLVDGVWKKADVASRYGTAQDKYNVVALKKPVLTKGLKIKLKLKDNYSAGVLEWRVNK